MIAAAPDLLEALQALTEAIDNDADLAYPWPAEFRERCSVYKKALAAIAKAIG